MHAHEHLKLAEAEDRMWYFRALHAHVRRGLHAGGLAAGAPAALLDAGCGTGGMIRRLGAAEPAWVWTGLDFSPVACELTRARCPGTEVRQGSITALPFDAGRFDAVVSMDVVVNVTFPADARRAVGEFARVVRPGGLVALNVAAFRWMWSYHDEAVNTLHRYSRREVLGLLAAAGLDPLICTYWNCLPFPLLVVKRKLFGRAGRTSDVHVLPRPLERGFDGVMAVERAWLRLVRRLPWGSSVFAVARKPG